MKEKNYQSLRDALDRLPEYAGPEDGWDKLQQDLTPSLAERLPSYQPPAGVWNALSHNLHQEATVARNRPRLAWRKNPIVRLTGMVAGFLLLLLAGVLAWDSVDQGSKVKYARSQEVNTSSVVVDWEEEEQSFTQVMAEIEARNEPSLNTLALELDELTTAKEDIKAMLVAYGDDPKVIRQLAEIERDRSDVYRRIIIEL